MTDQLLEAAVLLGVGMSVVFVFLTLLIGGIKGIQWYCELFPSNEQSSASQNETVLPSEPTPISPQLRVAIQTAVNLHRQQTK